MRSCGPYTLHPALNCWLSFHEGLTNIHVRLCKAFGLCEHDPIASAQALLAFDGDGARRARACEDGGARGLG